MRKQRILASATLIALELFACGPSELPAFANPPPEHHADAGPSDDTDAGEPGRDG